MSAYRILMPLLICLFFNQIAIAAPDIKLFTQLPNFTQPKLSPSGQRIAYLKDVKGRSTLIVQSIDKPDKIAIPPWDDKIEYLSFFWKTETYIVFRVRTLRLNRGKKRQMTRLVSLNLENQQVRWLGRPEKKKKGEFASLYESVVHELPGDKKHILVQLRLRYGHAAAVYKVNIVNGYRKEHVFRRKYIRQFYADHHGEVRLGMGYDDTQDYMRYVLRGADGKWLDLKKLDWADDYEVMGFSDNANKLYVTGQNKHNRKALYLLDLESGDIEATLFSDKDYDLGEIDIDKKTGKLRVVKYTAGGETEVLFDAEEAAFINAISSGIKKTVRIVHKARDAEKYVLWAGLENEPGFYLLFDKQLQKLSKLADRQKGVGQDSIFQVSQVYIPVSDGVLIPSILTRPSTEPAKNLAAVILPHGGPAGRSAVGWNPLAQFLASRGYLVLEPNFRGSTGYGKDFKIAGYSQWGGLMQTDISDTTAWLIEQGMVDKNRVCILGMSYGGYAAALASIMTPDLYQCAVSINGVHDLPAMKMRDDKYYIDMGRNKTIGLVGKEDKAVSPYHRRKEVAIPMLIIASKEDPRVPYKQSKSFYDKLRKLGKDVKLVTLKNDGHGMRTAESRLKSFQAVEAFLDKHLN